VVLEEQVANKTHKAETVQQAKDGSELVHLGKKVESIEDFERCSLLTGGGDKAGEDETEGYRGKGESDREARSDYEEVGLGVSSGRFVGGVKAEGTGGKGCAVGLRMRRGVSLGGRGR
jgi:hypothetical protein